MQRNDDIEYSASNNAPMRRLKMDSYQQRSAGFVPKTDLIANVELTHSVAECKQIGIEQRNVGQQRASQRLLVRFRRYGQG